MIYVILIIISFVSIMAGYSAIRWRTKFYALAQMVDMDSMTIPLLLRSDIRIKTETDWEGDVWYFMWDQYGNDYKSHGKTLLEGLSHLGVIEHERREIKKLTSDKIKYIENTV